MSQMIKVRRPTANEIRQLHERLLTLTDPHQKRRAEALTLYGMGLTPGEIATVQAVHSNTVYKDLQAFAQVGLEAVTQLCASGAPRQITENQTAQIVQLAGQSPQEVGLPSYGRWSLRKLRAYLIKRRIIKSLGRERLRQLLKKNGFCFRRTQRKLVSQDPRRPAILAHIRWIFKNLPAGGGLIFFDVKPVAVKAYGGRRYATAERLVLPRNQKTRGFFYLFTCYNATSGQAHWMFLPGKGSVYVIQFMRRIQRWYPDAPLWIVLDQDRAHPCKSRATRQAMRDLKLHWISLPKGSPDDNPVENIFSDIQLMILDNSNDPDIQTTQKRISAHLRGRNRRTDRLIRIPYLLSKHFHSD